MNEQVQEFLKQISKEIKRTEERIEEWQKELIKSANSNLNMIEEFGTAKTAETLTKLASRRKALIEQKYIFEQIFKDQIK